MWKAEPRSNLGFHLSLGSHFGSSSHPPEEGLATERTLAVSTGQAIPWWGWAITRQKGS